MDKVVKLNHRLKKRGSRQNSVTRPSRAEAEDAVRTLIRWAGDDPSREGLVGTPARVARAYEEWFSGYFEDPREYLKRTFEEVAGYDEIVLLRDIRFESHCEHHIAPILAAFTSATCRASGWWGSRSSYAWSTFIPSAFKCRRR